MPVGLLPSKTGGTLRAKTELRTTRYPLTAERFPLLANNTERAFS